MNKQDIITELQSRVCTFSYTKGDGTVREATGTLHASMLPETEQKSTTANHPTAVTYFDTDKQSWRAFHADKFLGFK